MKKPKATPTTATTVASPKGKDGSQSWTSNPAYLGGAVLGTVVVVWLGVQFFPKKVKPTTRTPSPVPESKMLDNYTIEAAMADGGTARVYRGRDPSGVIVAIKVPHIEQIDDREFVATFLREAQIGLELRHPSIVRVLHVGSYRQAGYKKIPFFVMEFLEGQELGDLIQKGNMEPQFAIMVARSVADALQWAHSRGVVHRDISPANIFITNKRLVKVMDFGISTVSARFTGKRQSKALSFGTPDYLAPERSIDSRSADARSDLYSLGCVLFEMISGHPPYVHENPGIVIQMHRKSPLPSLREHTPNSTIARPLELVVAKLLAKDPKNRYQNAGEVVNALAELIEES